MWLLALDTSTPQTALALGRVDKESGGAEVVATATHDDAGRPASALLGPRIEALLAEAGIAARAVEAVACGRGPGMFTGSRVALATAKGLAIGLGCPLFGVSTLACLAGSGAARGSVLALLDARRGEVYAARFEVDDHGPARRGEDRCCPLEHVLADMPRETWPDVQAVGPAGVLQQLPEELRARARAVSGVDGDGLWLAAARAALHEEPADVGAIDAVYLRASYAELGLNTPKRPPFRSPFV